MNPLDLTLFFRPADRAHWLACVQAVAQEGKCVLLHSPSPGVLDHYGQSLVQALRQQLPETATEIFFPAHSEALIARFNELLQTLSVDDATGQADPLPPLKLWVVHDANALPEHELKLLVRLLQQFPGARLAAVLMLTELPEWLRPIDPQGRRLHRWNAEPPSAEQAQAMVESARTLGREAQARELVARAVMPPPPPPPAPAPRPSPAPRPAVPDLRAAPEDHPLPQAAATPGRRSQTLALGLLLLLVSAGITAWLQPQATRALWQNLTRPPVAAPTAATASSPAEASASSPADSSTSPSAAPTASASAEAAATPAPVASEPSAPPAASAAQPAVAPASAASAASAAAAAAAPAVAEPVLTELPDLALKGLAWVKGLPPDTHLVRHSRWPTATQAKKLLGTGPLANARVVPHYPPGAEAAQFWVVVGPFRSEERARNHIGKNSWSQADVVSRSALIDRARPAGPSEKAR